MGKNMLLINQIMPCGYDRTNVPLPVRLKHYRICPDPACKARLQAWTNLKSLAAVPGGIKIKGV